MDYVEIAKLVGVEGFMHPRELELLVRTACNRVVLEVGSYRGLSAYWVAHVAKRLYCVDTFRAWTNGQTQDSELTTLAAFQRAVSRYNNVTHFVGSSSEYDRVCPKEQMFDMAFLDASHTYEDVLLDIAAWYPRVKDDGVIAFHDYGHGDFPGVKRAVDQVFGREFTVDDTLLILHKGQCAANLPDHATIDLPS